MKKIFCLILIITMVGFLFTGCGTTKKAIEDDDSEASVAAMSVKVNEALVTVNLDVLPTNHDWIASTDTDAAVPGAVLEVHRSWPYTDTSLVGSGTVYANGTFQIDLENKVDFTTSGVYLVQIEQGKRRSEPVIVTK